MLCCFVYSALIRSWHALSLLADNILLCVKALRYCDWENGRGLCLVSLRCLSYAPCLGSEHRVCTWRRRTMFQRLILRVCFKWSSWLLIGFLLFYIYVIALYFLYSNQSRVENYEYEYEVDEHPIHEHLLDKLPEGFKTWTEVINAWVHSGYVSYGIIVSYCHIWPYGRPT